MDDHGGCAEYPVFGNRNKRIEFGLRQSRQESWSKLLGKSYDKFPGRESAATIHEAFSGRRVLKTITSFVAYRGLIDSSTWGDPVPAPIVGAHFQGGSP
jgi:hypothetical protein